MSSTSPAPHVPQTADKAKVGGILSGAAVAVLMALAFYFDDRNGTNFTELLTAVLAGLGVGGATGKAVHKTANKPTHRRSRH
jgi:hypothetical protein